MVFKQTEEAKRKIGLARTGKKMSDEHKEIMRKKALDNNPMNNPEIAKKVSEKLKGRKFTEEHKKNMRKKHNLTLSKRKAISEDRKKFWRENPGKKLKIVGSRKLRRKKKKIEIPKEKKPRIANSGSFKKGDIRVKEIRARTVIPFRDTTIEVKIQNFLKEMNMEFYNHQYIREIEHSYQCDIFVPSMNLIIECDGDYWHNYPFGNDIDHIRTNELKEKGFKILRLWEREIRKLDLISFKEILQKISNVIEGGNRTVT